MKTHSRENVRMRLCKLDRRVTRVEIQCWNQDALNTNIQRPLDYRIAIQVEFVQVKVAMGIS